MLIVSVFAVGVLALLVYLVLLSRKSEMKRVVSTAAILIGHAQILGILLGLSLLWPPSVQSAGAFLEFDVLAANLSVAKPECVLSSGTHDGELPLFHITLYAKMGMIVALIAGLRLAHLTLGASCGRQRALWQHAADQLFFGAVVVHCLTFTIAIKAAFAAIVSTSDRSVCET